MINPFEKDWTKPEEHEFHAAMENIDTAHWQIGTVLDLDKESQLRILLLLNQSMGVAMGNHEWNMPQTGNYPKMEEESSLQPDVAIEDK